MTDPELGKSEGDDVGAGDALNAENEKEFNDHDASKAHLLITNGNGGAGSDPAEVKILDGPASSEGEVSFNGLSKDEVMKYADEPFWKRLRLILFILFWIGWTAMLGTAIVIIALAPRCPPRADLKWYQKETVYQVVPQSFKDGNRDGVGDFKGLVEKMPYIEGLGSKVIWLNNFYDRNVFEYKYNGRAIKDHMKIESTFGATEAELKNWIKNLNKEGRKVLVDFFPNQVSTEHEWFTKSQKKEGKYANYFIWKSQKPNQWKNSEGGDAWELDSVRKEYYYARFPGLPDLNLNNTDVQDEIMKIARYWLDAGVGGLHVNDVQFLFEDFENPDQKGAQDQPGTFKFLEKLRTLVDSYNKVGRERFIFAEVNDIGRNQTKKYWKCLHKGTPRLHVVVPVMRDLKKADDASTIRDSIDEYLIDTKMDSSPFWLGLALSDRHTDRIASRMEGSTTRLNAAHALQLLLPGTPFNYYGDEFGQQNGMGLPNNLPNYEVKFYGPMQWNSQRNAGFSPAKAWQGVPKGEKITAEAATAHFTSSSPLTCFKDLVALRAEESFQWGKTKFCAPDADLLMFSRAAERFPSFAVLMNLGTMPRVVSLAQHHRNDCLLSAPEGTVRFHSSSNQHVGEVYNFHNKPATLQPGDVVVIEFPAAE